jgi:hypothetical protein
MPVIPVTREMDIGEYQLEGSSGKKLLRSPSQSISWAWWHMTMIPPTWESIGRRIVV